MGAPAKSTPEERFVGVGTPDTARDASPMPLARRETGRGASEGAGADESGRPHRQRKTFLGRASASACGATDALAVR